MATAPRPRAGPRRTLPAREPGSSVPRATPGAATTVGFPALPAAVRKQLERLALRAPFDLVLHLPLRYEDETHLTRVRDALPGATAQVEVEVVATQVQFRPRRILVCRTR